MLSLSDNIYLIDIKSALAQVMGWHPEGDTALNEAMVTRICEAIRPQFSIVNVHGSCSVALLNVGSIEVLMIAMSLEVIMST